MKKFLLTAVCLLTVGSLSYALTNWAVTGTGSNRNTPVVYTDDSGNLTCTGTVSCAAGSLTTNTVGTESVTGTFNPQAKTQHGVSGVAVSSLTTSGTSVGDMYPVLLMGTVPAVEGSVLVANAPIGAYTTVTVGGATSNLTTVVGIAAAAASTGSVVNMYTHGFVLALTSGTVVGGTVLASTTAAAGYLFPIDTPGSAIANAPVAVSLSTGTTAGGLSRVLLLK